MSLVGRGVPPLHWAAGRGHAEVLKVVVAAGADKEAKSDNGATPLHCAAGYPSL